MKQLISNRIKKIAKEISETFVLTEKDVKLLKSKSPKLLGIVNENIKKDPDNPLKDLSKDDKLTLMAFIVYVRQNIATEGGSNPNCEDSAQILHGKIFKSDKELDEELIKQLSKAGIPIGKKKEDDKKE